MRYMFKMMNNARLSVGVEGLSLGERAYQQAGNRYRERREACPRGRRPGRRPRSWTTPTCAACC